MQKAASWESTAIQETRIIYLSVSVMARGNLGLGYSVLLISF